MPSTIAKLHLPVVRLIGRRLAAAATADRMRRVIGVAGLLLAPATGVTRAPLDLAGLGGLRIVPKAGAKPNRIVLLFHGGGYVFGSAKMYGGLAGRVAKAASATVVVPEYRLAPEHPHPAAVEDGLTAYRALLDAHPPEHIVVGGDSAGGGLTLAVVQAARDEGLPVPAGLFLMSPWLDLRGDASARANAATELLILPASIERAIRFYRGDHAVDDPAISPILGGLAGLPPSLVQVSTSEILYDDSVAFASGASAAGVEVTVETEDGLWHVWQLMAPALPEARRSIASIGRFVAGCST